MRMIQGHNWTAWVREPAAIAALPPTVPNNGTVFLGTTGPTHSVTRPKDIRRKVNRNHETIQRERKLARRIFGR